MAKVILENDHIKVDVPAGTPMRKVAEKTHASMNFGCRVGDCSSCIARVVSGMEYLSVLSPKEERLLPLIDGVDETMRLMCQCQIISDQGEVIIRYEAV